jgi:hypothetical protein
MVVNFLYECFSGWEKKQPKIKGPVYGALLKIIRGCFCEFYIL